METITLKPRRLRKGQEIGIIAPAGPVSQPELQPGIDLLKSAGHGICCAPHIYHKQAYVAGDDNERLQDLHAMFQNGRVKVIFCARGGYGTLRLLNKIDFDLIRRNPKIIVGYSDITALLLAIYKESGLVTYHGPVVKDLSKNRNQNLESFLNLVCSDEPMKLNLRGGRALRPGNAEGTLLGGNLSLICHLVGTPFMPSLRGAILFIEEKGEPLYRIDRMLTHLRLSHHLEGLAGLIAGEFEDCGDILSINQLLLETVSDLNIPLAGGLPVGHGLENISLPIGLQARLDTEEMTLSSTEPCVTT